MIAATSQVQPPGKDNIDQPKNNSRNREGGARLLSRLSSSFQRERRESGFW